ncbi:hypothetical protein BZA77DRAFT_327937 [Pyronema omphalodes]|nr:hypothetical protein BZA77DRAFT_327937 [Pyronema omphalodes]
MRIPTRLITSLRRPASSPLALRRLTLTQSRNCVSCETPSGPRTPVAPKAGTLPPDHRTISTAQSLLITSPYSPGSPLFLPHGTRVYNKLVEFLRAQYAVHGFQEVLSPNIYKKSLWETSGHWENYKEDMFEVSGRGAAVKDEGGVEEDYGLKPMNCPGHCLMFKATAGSRGLRDLPVRYADFSPLHRNENSGSLSGLTRVRRFHQDDGHIFCRPSQIAHEIKNTLKFIETAYRVFHLPKPELVLSTRPDNYIGELEEWAQAEAALTQALNESGQSWELNEGDGAFYGPKIDIRIQDSDGKKHQTATVQLDFQLPRRFGLEYLAPAPESEQKGIISEDPEELAKSGQVTPVLIHRAVMGSLERFMAILMEHHNGKWPFWLSPRQAIVIPVSMTEQIAGYAQKVQSTISGVGGMVDDGERDLSQPQALGKRTFHVDVDTTTNSLAKKIKNAKKAGYNHVIVVGERNVSENTVSVRVEAGESNEAKKDLEMTPVELYNHFVDLESRYA